jgi:hypothetical protein
MSEEIERLRAEVKRLRLSLHTEIAQRIDVTLGEAHYIWVKGDAGVASDALSKAGLTFSILDP